MTAGERISVKDINVLDKRGGAMSKTPFNFIWDYGDFSVRTAHGAEGAPYVELVHWYDSERFGRCCYTIAYWHKGKEGWDLRFVGDRMLELSKMHIEQIWPQLCAGQIMLQAWYEGQEEE